jgi:general secretion pathway protein G
MNEQSNPNNKSPFVKRTMSKWIKVVLWIFLILMVAVILLPLGVSRGPKARPKAARAQIFALGIALRSYQADNGSFPQGANALLCLAQRTPGATNWRGPYLNAPSVPKDPWGQAYIYQCPGKHNPQSYDLSAVGPDGQVYGNWAQK